MRRPVRSAVRVLAYGVCMPSLLLLPAAVIFAQWRFAAGLAVAAAVSGAFLWFEGKP
jgi:hypothetical protein